jgi:hypothetical protein
MNTLYKKSQSVIVAALVLAGMLIGGAVVYAQNEETAGNASAEAKITFPVPELGNCTDKASCKTYCDDGDHMEECVAFATAHGLMNKEEASRATKFASAVKEGKGPGGCTDPGSCKTYCEDVSHLEACVSFAEKQGFKGREFEQGKKLSAFVKSGGTMPGGCTSKISCQAYCSEFSHAEECSDFAQKSGMTDEAPDKNMKGDPKSGPQNMPSPEQFKMLAALAQKGETPGGCTNKDSCEAYCRADGHFEECMAFGEKVGFIKKDEAERMKKMMGKGGPGGCASPLACHAYCNEEANRETCFAFAEENGLIPLEEIEQMKEGMVRMRQGIENAPPEVVACLKSTLGESIIQDIQSGKLIPGPGIGEKTRACFEKFGGAHDPTEIFNNAPPEVTACLKEKLGTDFAAMKSGAEKLTPEMADSFRMCFQQIEMTRSSMGGQGGQQDAQKFQGFLHSAPPEVTACLKEKLGEEYEKISQGTLMPSPELGQTMRGCFEQFRPQMMPQNGMGDPVQAGQRPEGMEMQQMPPEVMACLKEKFGEEGFLKLRTTPKTPEIEVSMKACFDQFRGAGSGTGSWSMQTRDGQPTMMQQPSQMPQTAPSGMYMPPAVQVCIQEKLGAEGFALFQKSGPTSEIKIIVTACFEQFGRTGTMPPPTGLNQGATPPTGIVAPSQPSVGGTWVSRLPLPVQACLKMKLGGEVVERMGFAPPTAEIEMTIKACFTETAGTPPTDGGTVMMPPPDGSLPPPPLLQDGTQSRKNLGKLLLGAVAAPFVSLWGLVK